MIYTGNYQLNNSYYQTLMTFVVNNYSHDYLLKLAADNELIIKETPNFLNEAKKWFDLENEVSKGK